MKNVSHKKRWNSGTNPSHVEPPLILLTRETCNGKSEEAFVKLKLPRDPKSSTSDLYAVNIYFFDNGKPEEFMLFIRNFNTTIAVIGMLHMDVKIRYLCMLV